MNRINVAVAVVTMCASMALQAEEPYEFRRRLETVHQADRHDKAACCAADEIALADGLEIALVPNASELVRRAAADFVDYLSVSMNVDACVTHRGLKIGAENVLSAGLVSDYAEADRPKLKPHGYTVSVGPGTLALAGADERAVAQAFYHLEDVMNLRRAPFLKKGTRVRTPRFDVRMTHSGYGNDIFPEGHLNQMAHAGMTAILVFLDDIDKTKAQDYQDLKALIRTAKKYGLDTYLYSYIQAFVHPDDGDAVFEQSYGRIAGYYPEAKGIVLVGESCQFPSKDPRVQPVEYGKHDPNDKRPLAGWFPCKDYPQWLDAVKRAIHAKAPGMELVFWTYNWGWAPKGERVRLIDELSKDTTLMATFEMMERQTKRNGLSCPTADYSISFAGPGQYFSSEAVAAKRNGLRLYTQANSGGVTWDYGTVPFQPIPYQWHARWSAMAKAHDDWGLSGVMENHHFGWWPSFLSELEKEEFTEGGMPFEQHLRAIAVRDFGEKNADRALAVWKKWSDLARDYVPTDDNQYGPFRIGPAYPYNFGGKKIENKDFPSDRYASNGIGICRLNYLQRGYVPELQDEGDPQVRMRAELELLPPMAAAYDEGADFFAGIDTPQAKHMANLGRYLARATTTALNVKRGALAFLAGDKAAVAAIAREEYANAKAALPLVEVDSRLGWEPSMEYGGGPRQIRWKLQKMEALYGKEVSR